MRLRCAICGRADVALLEAFHKRMGAILVCPRCWEELIVRNEILVSGGGCPCE